MQRAADQVKDARKLASNGSTSEELSDALSIPITRLGSGSTMTMPLPGNATLQDLQDAVAAAFATGPLAFKLLGEDCSILSGNADTRLSELGLKDGGMLTMITDSARDYTRCSKPEHVIKTGSYPNGIAIDEDRCLYVSHYFGDLKVLRQLEDGSFKVLRQTKLQSAPRQVALAPSGELVIAYEDGISVLDRVSLKMLRCIKGVRCTGVALEGDALYASDSRKGEICKFQFSDGKLISTCQPGLQSPQAMCVVDGRLLAVADRGNNRVVLLDLETLVVQSQLPKQNDTNPKSKLSMPNDVIVDSGGNLLVMDTGNERIAVFREDGTLVASALEGFFKNHGNTFSYLYYHPVTGAIAVSNNDEHCITIFDPIFKSQPTSE